MPIEHVETLIVGGGQAGIAMSHMLSKRGRPHLILEQHRIAERWRTERWDGLRFQFPNWSVRLPDFPFPYTDPDGFASGPEIVDFIEAYAAFVAASIRCGVTVTRLQRGNTSGFIAETSDGPITAANVVVATGPYQRPIFPNVRPDDATLFQVHAGNYRNPNQLPQGAVLVVGCGASGAQIAEELYRAGRKVYLSVGEHRRLPRRYRGKDLIWWMEALGLSQTPVEKRGPARSLPVFTGAYGGHTLDFRVFAANGVTLLGRLENARHNTMDFAPDLMKSLAGGDTAYIDFLDTADAYVADNKLDMPDDSAARMIAPAPPDLAESLCRLDLSDAGIGSIIWATGYGFDFGWLDVPVLDVRGAPVHNKGITDVPGIYFIGLQWLSTLNSSLLSGMGDDAARLADHIAARG